MKSFRVLESVGASAAAIAMAAPLFALLLFIPLSAHAATFIATPITTDTTWTKSASPYVIEDGFGVDAGATLTMEPGVIVKSDTSFPGPVVKGRIVAHGTSDDKIVFTSIYDDTAGGDTNDDGEETAPVVGDWSLTFGTSTPDTASVFNQVVFTYAYDMSFKHAVASFAHVDISHANTGLDVDEESAITITDASFHDLAGDAIFVDHNSTVTANSLLIDMAGAGGDALILFSNATLNLASSTVRNMDNRSGDALLLFSSHATIEDTLFENGQDAAILLFDESSLLPRFSHPSSLVLTRSIIRDFGDSGVLLFDNATTTITDSTIERTDSAALGLYDSTAHLVRTNLQDGGSVGVELYDSWTLPRTSLFTMTDSLIQNFPSYGINPYESTVSVERSRIENNMIGIEVYSGRRSTNDVSFTITDSSITGNVLGAAAYGPVEIDARNNWWGDATGPLHVTANPDGLGDEVSDDVTFNPWLASNPFATTMPPAEPAFSLAYASGAEYADDPDSPGVDLNRGTASSTPFTFKVAYASADGTPPDSINLVLDATSTTPRTILLAIDPETETTSSATTTYAATRILPRGVHSYHFEATRGAQTVRLPEIGEWEVDAGVYVTPKDSARIRSSRDISTNTNIIGTAQRNMVIELLPLCSASAPPCNDDAQIYERVDGHFWLAVRWNGSVGYVAEDLLMTIVPSNQSARVRTLITERRADVRFDVLDNFPVEVFLALVSLESGGSFNNEVTSGDSSFGGIKQIHPSWSGGLNRNCDYNATTRKHDCTRTSNGRDWSNINPDVHVSDIFGTPITEKDGVIYMSKNYIGTLYNNTLQGLNDNIEDGFLVLKDKFGTLNTTCASGAQSTTIEGATISCSEKEIIKTLWAYNGLVPGGSETTAYLPGVADRLTLLPTYFTGPFVDTTHLQQALRVASRHKTIVRKFSPVYVQVYDAHGNVVGEFADGVHNTIPDAVVDTDNEAITLFFPKDQGTYTYRAVAFDTGSYGLNIQLDNGEASTTVALKDMPVTRVGEIDEYAVDPTAIAQGKPGVVQKIDVNGDGTFETTRLLYADGTPSDTVPPEARIGFATSTNDIIVSGFDDISTTTAVTTATLSIITDAADNTLSLTLARDRNKGGRHAGFATLAIPSFSYSTGTTTNATSTLRYSYATNPHTDRYNVFVSHIKTPHERLLAVYVGSLNRTIIVDARVEDELDDDLAARAISLLKRRIKATLSGLVIPYIETKQGSVVIQY